DRAERASLRQQTPTCSPAALVVRASTPPQSEMAQQYPDNRLDRKSRRTPKWAFFRGLLGLSCLIVLLTIRLAQHLAVEWPWHIPLLLFFQPWFAQWSF